MIITPVILRLGMIFGGLMGICCLVALWVGQFIPTTLVVGYLYHLQDQKHAFGIADSDRRLHVILPVPFQSDWGVILSPDGSRALMTLDFYSQVEFYMFDLTTHAVIRFPLGYNVCSPPGDTIRWSPDNRHVAFHCRPNSITSELNGLHLWDTHTNTIQQIYSPPSLTIAPYEWSPTGEFISLIDNGAMVIINTATRQTQNPSDAWRGYIAMRWSPQGDKLAMTARNLLQIYDLSTGITTRIFDDRGAGIGYWSPNGQWIATIAQQDGFSWVYTWHFADERAYSIGTNQYPMNMAVDLRWSGDSEWLLIQDDVNPANRFAPIFVANRDGTEGYRVTTDGRNPRWVRDSLTLTYQITQIERLRYGRDLMMVALDDMRTNRRNPYLLALDVLAYEWIDANHLLIWQSVDRYGNIRRVMIYPTGRGERWSAFPAGYNVNRVVLWR